MVNFQNIIKKNIPNDLVQPRRSQIYVGFGCHQKCGFCYYKSRCGEGMFPTDYVIRQIDLLTDYGITDFEITGGEPSECKNLRFYCAYIRSRNPNAKIAVITNGGLFLSDVWDIIDEVLVSYHIGRNPGVYDKSMFPLGCTYEKVKKTILKARENDILVRTNTVIGTFNMDSLDDIVDDLLELQTDVINFLPVNIFDEATEMGKYIDYEKLRPMIKSQIDKINEKKPGTMIFIRYMPFCDMVGYEKYIMDTNQHIFDWFDWNYELCGEKLLGYLEQYKTNDEILQMLGNYGKLSFDTAFESMEQFYHKSSKCLSCKYFMICDGVEKTNTELLKCIKPEKGIVIKNPMYFVGDSIQKFYNKRYSNGRRN